MSASKGVERITEKGIVANGVEYEVDCIIYASGFEITTEINAPLGHRRDRRPRRPVALRSLGRRATGRFHGMTSHGFPNQFFTGFTQGGVGANTTAMYEQQAEHIAYIISEALERGASDRGAQPGGPGRSGSRPSASTAIPTRDFLEECTPGYYNNEGGGDGGIRSALGEPYGPGFYAFDAAAAGMARQGRSGGPRPRT